MTFGDIEIQKGKSQKGNKILFCKKGFKQFIGYKDDDKSYCT